MKFFALTFLAIIAVSQGASLQSALNSFLGSFGDSQYIGDREFANIVFNDVQIDGLAAHSVNRFEPKEANSLAITSVNYPSLTVTGSFQSKGKKQEVSAVITDATIYGSIVYSGSVDNVESAKRFIAWVKVADVSVSGLPAEAASSLEAKIPEMIRQIVQQRLVSVFNKSL